MKTFYSYLERKNNKFLKCCMNNFLHFEVPCPCHCRPAISVSLKVSKLNKRRGRLL